MLRSADLQVGIFRRIESSIERAFEGGLGRTFKSSVQPVELARKLRKEMDDHRTISVSQVYVPNLYTVFLSPPDREQFATYEASLRTELAAYLTEHARREVYTLPGRVRVMIETADELDIGMFGIAVSTEEEPRMPDMPPHSPRAAWDTELPEEFRVGDTAPPAASSPPVMDAPPLPAAVAPVIIEPPPVVPTPAAHAPVVSARAEPPAASETQLVTEREARSADLAREVFALVWPGGRFIVDKRGVVIGRSRECDIVIDDRNTSRRHAELIRDGQSFVVRDLESTNGTSVNGRRVQEAPVAEGDRITLGATTLTLERVRT